jgi:oligosaccharyltransferase complex subunit beta
VTWPSFLQDDITYSLVIQEYDGEAGGWQPYAADDVQLEFVMLDPYIRTYLTPDASGRFAVTFKVPDVYGVYKFRVMYRRPGYTTLAVNTQVHGTKGQRAG